MSALRIEVPVLIVGGGPVGMLGALLCAQQGLGSLVVERRDGVHRAPQAHVVNPRSFEICRALCVDMKEIEEQAAPLADSGQCIWLRTLDGEEFGRMDFERRSTTDTNDSPTPMLNLSQHLFEPIVLERLRAEPRTEIRYGQQWESAQQDADGVTSRIRDLASGEVQEVRSRFVLAADGAGSRVRKSLDIPMDGPERLQSFVMIHFEGNLRPLLEDRLGVLYWLLNPDSRGVFVAHHIDHTWVFMHPIDAEKETVEDFTPEICAEIVQRAIGETEVNFTVRTISVWHMTAQIARRYRDGQIFLAGDAAHRFPPTGGIGMNTGIQDAHNLAWKLGAVEAGWAPPGLLDTYEQERRGVAQANSDQSLKNAVEMMEVGRTLGFSDDPVESATNMEAVLASAAGRQRLTDAIHAQRDHFNMQGLHLGFAYESGAVVPDGTAKPMGANPVSDYVPTTRPGSRLPHAWVERAGEKVSTLDLLPGDRFVVITGSGGDAWEEAAGGIESVPVACVRIGAGQGVEDPDGAWSALSEIGDDGALLVRPDGHVAWRSTSGVADAGAALGAALDAVLALETRSA